MSISAQQFLQQMCATVRAAGAVGTPMRIVGGDTKVFYGCRTEGEPLSIAELRGVLSYLPSELVITAWAGTPLLEIEGLLRDQGQMLACEPPHFGECATLGGMVASGLAGPRRPYGGGVRDCVLGLRCLSAAGTVLHFGGQVMKNVAGFDIARLMVGALGTLGVIIEVSLRVVPRPMVEVTMRREVGLHSALELMGRWSREPLPLSASSYDGTTLYVRLSGSEAAIGAARRAIGGEVMDRGASFWEAVREQALPFFSDERPLWRLSVPSAAPLIEATGEWFIEWGGAQRWLKTEWPGDRVREAACAAGGYAVLFRGGADTEDAFPLPVPQLWTLHRRLKDAFDPSGIFNRGRLYRDL